MKDYVKGVIQPGNNRHYIGHRRSLARYIIESIPLFALLTYFAYLHGGSYWLWLIGYVVFTAVYYPTLDKLFDNLTWNLLWRHIYPPTVKSAGEIESEQLMKKFAKSPTSENKRKLEAFFKDK